MSSSKPKFTTTLQLSPATNPRQRASRVFVAGEDLAFRRKDVLVALASHGYPNVTISWSRPEAAYIASRPIFDGDNNMVDLALTFFQAK